MMSVPRKACLSYIFLPSITTLMLCFWKSRGVNFLNSLWSVAIRTASTFCRSSSSELPVESFRQYGSKIERFAPFFCSNFIIVKAGLSRLSLIFALNEMPRMPMRVFLIGFPMLFKASVSRSTVYCGMLLLISRAIRTNLWSNPLFFARSMR